ncbi:MAG: chorismate synthase [Candidatus Latescibacteria bacterium]|nr:chorismate synthase [Candidatus Latescibacterota bacterium]
MFGNTFGRIFRITACGESYGKGLAVIVDGVPAGLSLTEEYIQRELDKRKPGQSALDSPRKETDVVQIFAGMLEGKTTGAPVGLIIYNVDTQKIHVDQYREVKDIIRPGHAEYTFFVKYGEYADWCGAGRASGRETVGRVAGGAVAKYILEQENIEVLAYTRESHGIVARDMTFDEVKANYRKNEINCPDLEAAKKMIDDVLDIREKGDTAGGVTEVIIRGVPAGLGEPVFDKLSADLAKAIMSIGACKGFEIGAGFKAAKMTGYEWNDEPYVKNGKVDFRTNNQGGILGGISTGQDIVLRVAVKATPTISIDQNSVNMDTMQNSKLSAITRRDASLLPRIYPVIEAMTRCVILDHLYMWRAWCGMQHYENKWKNG